MPKTNDDISTGKLNLICNMTSRKFIIDFNTANARTNRNISHYLIIPSQ